MDVDAAKWSRNLSGDSGSDSNRFRLIERQRQLMESKRHRATAVTATATRQSSAGGRKVKPMGNLGKSFEKLLDLDNQSSYDQGMGAGSSGSVGGLVNPVLDADDHLVTPSTPIKRSPPNLNSQSSVSYGSPESGQHHYMHHHGRSSLDTDSNHDEPQTQQHTSTTASSYGYQRSKSQPSSKKSSFDLDAGSNQMNNEALLSTHYGSSGGGGDRGGVSSTRTGHLVKSSSAVGLGVGVDDDTDNDDNQSSSVVPGVKLNPLTSILSNQELLEFATSCVPPTLTYQCTIIRDKKGLDRSFYPAYYMHLQAIVTNDGSASLLSNTMASNDANLIPSSPVIGGGGGGGGTSLNRSPFGLNSSPENNKNNNLLQDISPSDRPSNHTQGLTSSTSANNLSSSAKPTTPGKQPVRQVFLLSGRRRKKSKTYLIGADAFDISRENCIAKIKSNVLGTQFNAFRIASDKTRYEMASIFYETNVLGFKGPRKMTVLVSRDDQPISPYMSLVDEAKRNNKSVITLKNKTPVWNEETQSYVLNFHGRVTQASVKNFQLVPCAYPDESLFGNGPQSASGQQNSTQGHGPLTGSSSMSSSDSAVLVSSSGTPTTPKSSPFIPTAPLATPNGNQQGNNGSTTAQPNEELISMQFGRVSDREFSCDVTWPLSLLQAFAIALTSFDSKLACE